MLKRQDEFGRANCATSVKTMLFNYGFGYIWVNQDVGTLMYFYNFFEDRLICCNMQKWSGSLFDSSRCETYRCINHYLIHRNIFRLKYHSTIEKHLFRCSNHKFLIETGRHVGKAQNLRYCTHCLNVENNFVIENEFHVFFQCSKFHEERNMHSLSWYSGNREEIDFINLIKRKMI